MATHQEALDKHLVYYVMSMSTENYDCVRNPFINVISNVGLQLCVEGLVTISRIEGSM